MTSLFQYIQSQKVFLRLTLETIKEIDSVLSSPQVDEATRSELLKRRHHRVIASERTSQRLAEYGAMYLAKESQKLQMGSTYYVEVGL
jgi:ribosomal protein S10